MGILFRVQQAKKLKNQKYKVFINSSFKNGNLKLGELLIKGKTEKEVLISTYICHPSMANNEISGIVVATKISSMDKKKFKFSYRFLFLPETIGSIAYLSKNLKKLKKNVIAGYVLTCIGDDRNFSLLSQNKKIQFLTLLQKKF